MRASCRYETAFFFFFFLWEQLKEKEPTNCLTQLRKLGWVQPITISLISHAAFFPPVGGLGQSLNAGGKGIVPI